jgi:hypothetical protein
MLSQTSGLYVRLDKLGGAAPKLCKQCKYFMAPRTPTPTPIHSPNNNKSTPTNSTPPSSSLIDLTHARCKYFAEIHLVHGETTYPFAAAVRPTLCNGDYFVLTKEDDPLDSILQYRIQCPP